MDIRFLLLPTAACLIGLAVTGRKIGWGPFRFLFSYGPEVKKLLKSNPYEDNQNRILFYGASNFRLWTSMQEDIREYMIVNNAFGGSTDRDLIRYSEKLLYPYHPAIVVLQTGSNDYVRTKGSEKEILEKCYRTKLEMYDRFHAALKDTPIIILAGIVMPGREKYNGIVRQMNAKLKDYCSGKDYLYFVDSEKLTCGDEGIRRECFVRDGIHLTPDTRKIWYREYLKPELDRIAAEYDLKELNR